MSSIANGFPEITYKIQTFPSCLKNIRKKNSVLQFSVTNINQVFPVLYTIKIYNPGFFFFFFLLLKLDKVCYRI